MIFKIKSVTHDGRNLILSPGDNVFPSKTSNTFSIIVGRNSTGKSRLLRKIASNYIFKKNPAPEGDGQIEYHHCSSKNPSNIIAVSTGHRDKFPPARHYDRSKEEVFGPEYIYIGARRGMPSSTGTLSRAFLHLLDPNANRSGISESLDYLGLSSKLVTMSIRYSSNFHIAYKDTSLIDVANEALRELGVTRKNNELKYLNTTLQIKNLESPVKDAAGFLLVKNAIERGAINIYDVGLLDKKTKSVMRLNEFSSGQQCMLQIFLGIAGGIQDGSLILIDEPEISLHPYWQSEIIIRLQEIFSEYRGCHFIIATHSPQIISDMTSNNSHVINMETGLIFNRDDYALKSADFQLAEIFEEPGNKNEYLLRSSLKILTKLAKGEQLTEKENSEITLFHHLRARIQENDPVGVIIDQVLALHD